MNTLIYITGDIHGSIDINKMTRKAAKKAKREGKEVYELMSGDYLIICGDFGLVWSKETAKYYKEEQYWIKWLEKKPYKILFVDGNHENHDILDTMPVSEWNGGKVHYIAENVIHLMRGQVFEIEGHSFFTMGGASSHDKQYRVEGESWWARELPNQDELDEAKRNLAAHNNTVDYIITHCAPQNIQYKICPHYPEDDLILFFEDLEQKLTYKRWYNGHYHCDLTIGKHTIVYDDIIPLQ